VGKGRGGMEGTHYNDDSNDYCHCASSFVVVVARCLPLLFFSCSMVAMSLTRRGPASGMKKKGGGDVCYCSPVMRIATAWHVCCCRHPSLSHVWRHLLL
jgi:hypothetical protein